MFLYELGNKQKHNLLSRINYNGNSPKYAGFFKIGIHEFFSLANIKELILSVSPPLSGSASKLKLCRNLLSSVCIILQTSKRGKPPWQRQKTKVTEASRWSQVIKYLVCGKCLYTPRFEYAMKVGEVTNELLCKCCTDKFIKTNANSR